jgi:hypothetical protein
MATKWMDELARVRAYLTEFHAEDGKPEPTDEQVLAQFVYEAVSGFIERDDYRLIGDLLDEDFDVHTVIDKWIEA